MTESTRRLSLCTWTGWICAIAYALLLPAGARSQDASEQWSVGPVPDWVKVETFDVHSVMTPEGEPYQFILLDAQVDARKQPRESYTHAAWRLKDAADVQQNSQITIEFDPQYEQIVLHSITLRRGDRQMDRLDPNRIELLQRETGLEHRLYDGHYAMVLFCEDVQIGDVLEYSYTRVGSNPVFEGRYMGGVTLQGSIPMRSRRFRLLWPDGRPLFMHDHGAVMSVRHESQLPGCREIIWEGKHTRAILHDGQTPIWYDAAPWVQVSEFETWGKVVEWGLEHYPVLQRLSKDLDREIDRIAKVHSEAPERMLSALRFVSDEVRYMGIEVGPGAYAPSSPNDVLKRRFGDCKDKSYLLVTMLQHLGIDAAPAYVSHRNRHTVADWHPSPLAFDHVIVRASLPGALGFDTSDFWLDPTQLYARGDLWHMGNLDFGQALVIAPGVTGLQEIEQKALEQPHMDVRTRIKIANPGELTRMTVTTAYRGQNANWQRYSYQTQSAEELGKAYLNYYGDLYASIEIAEPLEFFDDEEKNRVEVVEEYNVDDFWTQEGTLYMAELYPLEMASAISAPDSRTRTMPLALSYPYRLRCTIEAQFDEGWAVKPESLSSEGPASRFAYSASIKDDLLILRYDYMSLADHVPVGDIGEHIKHVEEIQATFSFPVSYMDNTDGAESVSWRHPSAWNWPIAFLGVFAAAGWLLLAVRLWRWKPSTEPATAEGRRIGGWLILVAIGVVVSPFLVLYEFSSTLSAYSLQTWSLLTDPGSYEYHSLWAPTLIFELLSNIGLMIMSPLLLVTFFKKRSLFPRLYIALALAQLVMVHIDLWFTSRLEIPAAYSVSEVVATWLRAGVWGTYMWKSVRVKETFVL